MMSTGQEHVHIDREAPTTGSPLWYVTNGLAVVGPVDTELLLRGITSARIPNDCMVAQESWSSWRSLDQIREVSRLRRSFAWSEDEPVVAPGKSEELVTRARNAGEALLFAMSAAVTATRATAALVHRLREPFVGLVTSSAFGPKMDDQLGQVVPRLDPALALAESGQSLMASLTAGALGAAERAVARRFSDSGCVPEGIAMVPIFDGGKLLAMIEVARADHPFRKEDAELLSKIAALVSAK